MKCSLLLVLLPMVNIAQEIEDKRDGNRYRYTERGGLHWMTEDLRFEAEGSICLADCEDIRFYDYRYLGGACPTGWRLPTVDEWDDFTTSFEEVEKVRMFEANEKVYRVDFLDGFDLFESNVLNVKAYGRIEGGQLRKGSSIDYWATNPSTNDRFHMHLTPHSITGHTHKHHLKPNKPQEFRLFPIRCVCEELE